MGTRVRAAETLGPITLGKAYLRLVLKYIVSILGAASGPSAAGTPFRRIPLWSMQIRRCSNMLATKMHKRYPDGHVIGISQSIEYQE